jgi:hypothetical protein
MLNNIHTDIPFDMRYLYEYYNISSVVILLK